MDVKHLVASIPASARAEALAILSTDQDLRVENEANQRWLTQQSERLHLAREANNSKALVESARIQAEKYAEEQNKITRRSEGSRSSEPNVPAITPRSPVNPGSLEAARIQAENYAAQQNRIMEAP